MKRTIAAQIHLAAAFAATLGLILILVRGRGFEPGHQAAVILFGASGVFLFLASACYHFFSDGLRPSDRLENLLQKFDHLAIYIFIAGSYTAVLMKALHVSGRFQMLTLIWCVASIGIAYTIFRDALPRWLANRFLRTGIYLLMGWLALLKIGEIAAFLSTINFSLLVAGGLSYSLGSIFYATDRPKLFEGVFGAHELWHLFVVLGYGLHYSLVFNLYSSA